MVAPSAAERSRSRRTAELSCASSMLSVSRVSLSCTARTWKVSEYASRAEVACSGTRNDSVSTPSNWFADGAAGSVRLVAPVAALRTT